MHQTKIDFEDVNSWNFFGHKYQKMWKHMVNWIKQSLEAIHICICKYNPISSWQSSKTNQAHCPVQDVTTKGVT